MAPWCALSLTGGMPKAENLHSKLAPKSQHYFTQVVEDAVLHVYICTEAIQRFSVDAAFGSDFCWRIRALEGIS